MLDFLCVSLKKKKKNEWITWGSILLVGLDAKGSIDCGALQSKVAHGFGDTVVCAQKNHHCLARIKD
jgi:hypothetical protein